MLLKFFFPDMNQSEIETALEDKFMSKEKFAEKIESMVLKSGLNYIDSIVEYCQQNNLEIEAASKLVSKVLKEKIKADAVELNYISKPKQTKLSFE